MMTTGAGPGPTLAAGEALSAQAGTMLGALATSGGNAGATFADWTGAGGSAAEWALVTLNTQHLTHADETVLKAALFQQAATLYSTTVTRMVPDVLPDANRMESAVDNLINPWVLGMLTPRITELELEYQAMWVNNAQAGVGYGFGLDGIGAALAGLAGLAGLPAIAGGSLAAPAMAGAQIAETAAISGLGAAMSTAEQGATALISPATATTSSATNAMLGDAPLAAPATPSSSIQPMAAVTTHPAPTPPSLAQAQTPVMGMFAPPPSAAVTPPAPSPALPATPQPAPMTPPMPAAAPGVTSFIQPAQPFSPPPPTAGRAAGLAPGMLNAAALRGPVSTMPLTTTVTSTLATATQPLAYAHPDPPRPPVPPTPPQPPLLNTGDTAHTLNPPPPPTQLLQPSPPAPQPAPPQGGPPPGPSTGSGGPNGSGGPGAHMPGSGPGQAPQAPPVVIPLDTRSPIPPPPEPGQQPLRPPSPPSWAQPPVPQSVQAAQNELRDLERLIQQHNDNPPNTSDPNLVALYNAEADYYNSWAAQLHGKLDSWNAQYTPATTAKTAEAPSWTQPAPQQPVQQGPSSTTQSTPPLIDKVPLQTDLRQVEEKYSQHAKDFGVDDPRGRAGFDKFDSAVKQLVDDPDTLHIQGTYRGQPAILNYNPDSGLCVVQSPDGRFISGWKLSSGQVQNVLTRGSL